jgi:hypothetical protein
MSFMNAALAGKDPGEFQPPPESGAVEQRVDTPDTSPSADEAR